MKNIRNSVFETNSSSTHSICISPDFDCLTDTIIPNEDGTILILGKEFDWGIEYYNDCETKVSYLLTSFHERNKKAYERVTEIVKEHTGAKNVVFDLNDGYIDHQSYEVADDLLVDDEFIKVFLFNPKSELIISNDNM
jgi:hypothetical protein